MRQNHIKIDYLEGRNRRVAKRNPDKRRDGVHCQRCQGQMAFEKFYGQDNSFFGWHCITCGDILDPVILLHRLSHNPDLPIPEREEEVFSLIKKYEPSSLRKMSKG